MFYTNPDYVKFFFTEDELGNIMMGAAWSPAADRLRHHAERS